MPSHATPQPHLYIHQPTALFKARVNQPSAVTYPITAIAFDGVTLGAFGDIEHDMTLVLGTADGLDDLGRTRVQKIATSTEIPVARVSRGVEDGTLEIVDNAYITIYADDFRVWAKLPYQSPDGIDYKDGDVPVGTFLVDIPPVPIMGPGFAGYTSGGIITVSFDAGLSYAMSDGATITTYAWDVKDGTITVGSASTAAITVTFPAGFRQIGLTVTDSNGVPNTGRRPILAVNAAADVTIQQFAIRSHRLTQQGATLDLDIYQDLPRSTYPDGTLVMLWYDAAAGPSDRSHMKFIGWEQSNDATLRATKPGLVRETTLHAVDVAGRLESLPAFPQAIQREDEEDVDEQWSLMPDATISKVLHYLAFWHSTALGVADFFLPATGNDYPSMRLDTIPSTSTMRAQIDDRAQSLTPDHLFVCNAQGQLSFLEDWMYIDVGDRPAAAPILVEDDYGDLAFPYQRPPRVHVLRASAVVCSTEWMMLGGVKTLPLAFSIAPGETFGQGTTEETAAEGLTISQAQLNMVTGHRYARLNARFGSVRVTLLDPTTIWDFEPALMQRIQLNIAAAYAAQRGLPFTAVNVMVKDLNISYRVGKDGLALEAQATLELETSGPAAVTHVPETEGDPDDYEVPPPPPPTVPPEMGLREGVEMVAAIGIDGFVYRTTDFQTPSGSGGPTWDSVDTGIADTIYSWVVDPFSPGYISGVGFINGWIACDDGIYRVEDLFGSATATLVHSFLEATVGASFHWRSIQASFGAFFGPGANPWLVCVSYYGDTPGHEGTWVTRCTDGVTWSDEVQISADYDATVQTRFMPIGIYTSPKTPGLAYTVAHVATAGGPLPRWGTSDGVAADFALAGASAFFSTSQEYTSPPVGLNHRYLMVGPPSNTKHITVEFSYHSFFVATGTPGGAMAGGGNLDEEHPTGYAPTAGESGDIGAYTPPTPPGGDSIGGFFIKWSQNPIFAGDPWPQFSTTITPTTATGCRLDISPSAQDGNLTTLKNVIEVSAVCTEIELQDGTIYSPIASETKFFRTMDWGATWELVEGFDPIVGQGGSIHLPWPMNADEQLAYYGSFDNSANHEFRLMQANGATQTDISPSASGVNYGVYGGSFAVRSFDSDRQFMAVGGYGNDTSALVADDKVGLWVSSNAGAAWTNILTPAAASNAPRGLQIAFGGDDSDILFAWGGKSDGSLGSIYYSDDFGAALDSREGNMNSLGVTTLIGIAGGPTG